MSKLKFLTCIKPLLIVLIYLFLPDSKKQKRIKPPLPMKLKTKMIQATLKGEMKQHLAGRENKNRLQCFANPFQLVFN